MSLWIGTQAWDKTHRSSVLSKHYWKTTPPQCVLQREKTKIKWMKGSSLWTDTRGVKSSSKETKKTNLYSWSFEINIATFVWLWTDIHEIFSSRLGVNSFLNSLCSQYPIEVFIKQTKRRDPWCREESIYTQTSQTSKPITAQQSIYNQIQRIDVEHIFYICCGILWQQKKLS